jgi:PIN domain nuclease of toxin-antitoxin system
VRLLLDSNVFIWMVGRPRQLSATVRQELAEPRNDRFVSVASMWEISIKISLGKLTLPGDLGVAVEGMAARMLPISMPHVARIQRLPFHHRDPFDRILVAQAIEEGLTIVTRDRRIAAYGIPVLVA